MERTIDRRLKEYTQASKGNVPGDQKGQARDQATLDAWSARASKYSYHNTASHDGEIPGVSHNNTRSRDDYMPNVRRTA